MQGVPIMVHPAFYNKAIKRVKKQKEKNNGRKNNAKQEQRK